MSAAERFGAPQQIRLSDLPVFIRPPAERAMAVITDVLVKGYLDDSYDGQVWALGGYVGGPAAWEEFETDWPMALARIMHHI
jgi:hypothetical protein